MFSIVGEAGVVTVGGLSGRYDFHEAKGERYCVEEMVKMMA